MMTDASDPVWNHINLNNLRHIMDPTADQAIEEVYRSKSFDQLRAQLQNMAENDDHAKADMPPALHSFLQNELKQTFTAEDIAQFELARETWKENASLFIFSLFFRSLPYTYAAEKPANVLRLTKLLELHPDRRIFETAQFIFDVMDRDWWMPEKRGILTALKIRLMHAAMRYNLLNNPEGEPWNKEAWGMPISQEDLIATNQVFSLEFLKGMEIMDQPLSESQKQAWYYTWKKIGSIMGVQKNLLCETYQEAWDLQHTVYNHLFTDDVRAGIALSKALVTTLDTFMMSEKFILLLMRRMIFDDAHPDIFYKILGPTYGEKYSDIFQRPALTTDPDHEMQLHEQFKTEFYDHYQRVKNHLRRQPLKADPLPKGQKNILESNLDLQEDLLNEMNKPGLAPDFLTVQAKVMRSIGGIMVGLLSDYFRESKGANFRIPKDLKEHWGLLKPTFSIPDFILKGIWSKIVSFFKKLFLVKEK